VSDIRVRAYVASDRDWVDRLLTEALGGRWQARRGELVDVLAFEGLVAEVNSERVGYVSYRPDQQECELVAIVATRKQHGVGTALLQELEQQVPECKRIWLVTTNDNLEALRFYQRRGFHLRALRPGAVDEARTTLKPSIGRVGDFGIPIRDELELELLLEGEL
jgi:ribosomal protein S18 acetylase RimI-like enzyme